MKSGCSDDTEIRRWWIIYFQKLVRVSFIDGVERLRDWLNSGHAKDEEEDLPRRRHRRHHAVTRASAQCIRRRRSVQPLCQRPPALNTFIIIIVIIVVHPLLIVSGFLGTRQEIGWGEHL